MKVVFTPKDGTRREWPFEPDDIEMVDASFIKKQTRMTHSEWKKAILEQDADALHGLLWVLHKLENPLFRWTDVRFRMNEVTFEFDDTEVGLIVDRFASLTPEEATGEDVTALRMMIEMQGVDVDAKVAERLADPEFEPLHPDEKSAGVEDDPKA